MDKKNNDQNETKEDRLVKSVKKLFLFVGMALILNRLITLGPRGRKIKELKNDKPIEQEVEKKSEDIDETVRLDEEGRQVIIQPDDYLVLVNKDRFLPNGYEPKDLVPPKVNFVFEEDLPKRYLRKEAAHALEELFEASLQDGIELYASSGYRSYTRQEEIFKAKLEKDGMEEAKKLVAYPGQSEHQTGLAMDLTSRDISFKLEESFEATKEGKWLRDKAHNFGFIIRYPKDKVEITKYSYEPWHIRYVGKEAAQEIYLNKLTLEEYLGLD